MISYTRETNNRVNDKGGDVQQRRRRKPVQTLYRKVTNYSKMIQIPSEINVVLFISADLMTCFNTIVHFDSTVLQHASLVKALNILPLAHSSVSQVELPNHMNTWIQVYKKSQMTPTWRC